MTPEEFAADHGLSVEEATLILERRSLPKPPPGGRLALALKAMNEALAKTGVAPVTVKADGRLEKSGLQDPEALDRFYSTKRPGVQPLKYAKARQPTASVEDQSQDPEDWK